MICNKDNISYLLVTSLISGLFFINEIMMMRFVSAVGWFLLFILLPVIGIIIKSFHYRLIISVFLFLFWTYILVATIVGNYKAGLLSDNLLYVLALFVPFVSINMYIYILFKREFFKV